MVAVMVMVGCMAMKCQEPEATGVRQIQTIESLLTGVHIQLDNAAIKAGTLIVREKPCYEGSPTRQCLWVGVSCPECEACPACEACPVASEEQ
jgi:hypothetical protein